MRAADLPPTQHRQELVETLCHKLEQLGEAEIRYQWAYVQGYNQSEDKFITGREHDAQAFALDAMEDKLRLSYEVEVLKVMLDYGASPG